MLNKSDVLLLMLGADRSPSSEDKLQRVLSIKLGLFIKFAENSVTMHIKQFLNKGICLSKFFMFN